MPTATPTPDACLSDSDWYAFYDVPVPANLDPMPNGPRDQSVNLGDVLAVLFYSGARAGGPANGNGVAYDSVKGSCDWNGDTVADAEGMCYDRTPGPLPNPPFDAGPPDGAVSMADLLVVLAQVGLQCNSPTATATPIRAATRTATATSTPTNTPSGGGVWRPAQATTWQYQLTGSLDTSVAAQMYDIDLFDNSASVVAALHSQGRKVICYIDAGTWENWRPDAGAFPASVKGKSNGWPGENWLDVRNLAVLGPIMGARLDLCKSKGFDGADFDNMDGYENSTGFPLTAADQIAYSTWLANAAHARGLAVGLKNDLDQVTDLEPSFDFAIVEQCFEYGECDKALPFIEAGKAVFEVEYSGTTNSFCPEANAMGFMSMKKLLSLDAWRQPCWN